MPASPQSRCGVLTVKVFDADAHVEESADTFADRYLDPAWGPRRPNPVLLSSGNGAWIVDDVAFPKKRGRGTNFFATPPVVDGQPTARTSVKPDGLASIALRPP